MSEEPWQRYETPGPIKAILITKPEVVSALLKRAKNPIIVAGHRVSEVKFDDEMPIDYVIRISKATDTPVIATAHTVAEFLKRGFQPTAWMTAMDIGYRLIDPEWSVSGRKAPHDLAFIIGFPYYVGWVITSGLKSFAFKHLKTISIDRYYQPHCDWSFRNLSVEEWFKNLALIAEEVERK